MHHKTDRITSLCKEQEQSKSKLQEAQKERSELREKLHELESKIVTASQGLHQLQLQQQSARAALQLQEQAINERLVSSTEHQYYNVVIQDGKVELKLTQQQVETLHRKIDDENLKVKRLHGQLEFHQQKLRDITRQNELLDRKGQAAAELEKHQRAYLQSTMEADVMQCQIEISTTEFRKQEMENRIHSLRVRMKNLRKRQGQYEQIAIRQNGAPQTFKLEGATHTDFSHFSPTQRVPSYSPTQRSPKQRKPLQYQHSYREGVDRPSVIVHPFRRSRSTHPTRPVPVSSNGEQHRPFSSTATQFIPGTHAPLFRNRSLHEGHHRPHPPIQHFSAYPYFSNSPYKGMHRSAGEEYAGLPDEGYVIQSLGPVENDSMLNGGMYEPMACYSSHELDGFSQEAKYLPSNGYDIDDDDIDEVDECYAETDFTEPSHLDLAPPPRPSKNKYT